MLLLGYSKEVAPGSDELLDLPCPAVKCPHTYNPYYNRLSHILSTFRLCVHEGIAVHCP